ncbi:hypothetical protein [Spirosoma aerolatum]|uniref:hypothetical protein n=1 Tax=Spirosoma aerolatum TaxID=1211326 RepID=UPI0009AEAA96|nr:hypothetical protein [Spirosoma aerolatum]
MDMLSVYAERLKHLPIDLKAEVVLADMLEDGVSLDELVLNPEGLGKRTFGRDISQTEWKEAQHTSKRWLQIDLNRSGLYDLLPEGVFHQPTANEVATSKEAILREMSIQREREKAARTFFLPFEQEFFRQRIRLEQEQRAYPVHSDTEQPNELLSWFWNLPNFLTSEQVKRLLYILPVIHHMVGDPTAMKACYEQLMEERVSLQLEPGGMTLVETDTAPLGEWQLGESSVVDGWLRDEEPLLRIIVHIDRTERVANYLPGSDGRRMIEWLAGYLAPLDAAVGIELDTSALNDTFLLAENEVFGRLDFTTNV